MEEVKKTPKRLTRSPNKMAAGVIAGFAEYFEMDVTLLRVVYALLTAFSAGAPGFIAYLICWMVMPPRA